ncbi:MAG: 3'(2'),5'-bisphosphate nucleotidase CysQ [Saprospiraceae bacterium]
MTTLSTEQLKSIALSVTEIAQRAGDAIIEIYNAAEGIQIEKKADNSPLTIADRTANGIICEGLEKLEVQFPIVSEENKEIPYSERKDFTYSWLVDPLDGTKEFIKRNGEFTVNIALIYQQRSVLGVVYAPVMDEMYWAVENGGSYLIKNGETTQLTANSFNWSDTGLKIVCSRSHLNDATKAFVEKLDQPELVATGSSLKFLLMAKGTADAYPRLGPTMEWDTGAAHIVLKEAGGQVIDEETKEELLYNKENLLNPYFVAVGNLQD